MDRFGIGLHGLESGANSNFGQKPDPVQPIRTLPGGTLFVQEQSQTRSFELGRNRDRNARSSALPGRATWSGHRNGNSPPPSLIGSRKSHSSRPSSHDIGRECRLADSLIINILESERKLEPIPPLQSQEAMVWESPGGPNSWQGPPWVFPPLSAGSGEGVGVATGGLEQ